MARVVLQIRPLKDDRCILILDEKIPSKAFKKYRIGGKEYEAIPVHVPGENLLKAIGLKGEGEFTGKEVEFI